MSLSLFPPRELPPPVPPKARSPPRIDTDLVNQAAAMKGLYRKGSLSSVRRHKLPRQLEISVPRVPSPTRACKSDTTATAKKRSPIQTSPNRSPIRVEKPFQQTSPKTKPSAKQRAREVWISWKKPDANNSQTNIQTAYGMDSPTIPGHHARARRASEGRTVICKPTSPPIEIVEAVSAKKEGLQPIEFLHTPTSPWPGPGADDLEHRPAVPPKSPAKTKSAERNPSKAKQLPVTTTERCEVPPPLFRHRADSAPSPLPQDRVCDTPSEEMMERFSSVKPLIPLPLVTRHRRNQSESAAAKWQRRAVTTPELFNRRLQASPVKSLQLRAKEEASKFDMLSPEDFEALSTELPRLDLRCRYLRDSQRALREDRKKLHERILNYLRAPKSSSFSQERLLKQEECLAELDTLIDEWETKMEIADMRRMHVKQRLLEHVAATLALRNPSIRFSQEHLLTPPLTPDTPTSKNKESITIYALLADVKEEITRGI